MINEPFLFCVLELVSFICMVYLGFEIEKYRQYAKAIIKNRESIFSWSS